MQDKNLLARLPITADLHQMHLTKKVIDGVIQSEKPDIIQANSPVLNALPALRSGKQYNLPVVYEVRAFWEDAAVTAGVTREGSLRYKVTHAMETYALRRADAVTTICEGLRDDIVSRGISAAKVTIIPNAVDTENFTTDVPRDMELAKGLKLDGRTVLGFVGSFYVYEGLDLLVSALPKILDSIKDASLLLVGGGPVEASLKTLAADLGVSDHVVFTGRVPQSEVSRYYGLVDLLVYARHSTRLTELVTPLKPLEAMAQKRPFLASDVGGHKELIRDNETGFLFRAGDLNDLAKRTVELLAGDKPLQSVLDAGRKFVETERSWNKSVAGYQNVFDRILRQ